MVTAVREPELQTALRFLWLEIIGRCNLTCSHCYADSGPQVSTPNSLSFDDWVLLLEEAAGLGCRQMQFIGGEPTLHPELDRLICKAEQSGFELIEVFTNATRLSSQLLACFQEHRVNVATSFYSTNPQVHESITRVDGSWERTVEGIQKLIDQNLPLRVGIIETPENAGHAPEAKAFLQSMGARNIQMDTQRGVGRGGLIALGEPTERFDQLCGQCWKGRLCVGPDGEAFPCVFSRATRLGNIRQGLARILSSSALQQFRQKVRKIEQDRLQGSSCTPESCMPNSCMPNTCMP